MGFFRMLFDGQHGLAYSNVRAYCTARQRGLTHHNALSEMIRSRYPKSEFTRGQVLERMGEVEQGDESIEQQLRSIIGLMYTLEVGVPKTLAEMMRFENELDAIIAEHRRKYPEIL